MLVDWPAYKCAFGGAIEQSPEKEEHHAYRRYRIRYDDGDRRWYEHTENGLRSLQKRARDPVASCTESPRSGNKVTTPSLVRQLRKSEDVGSSGTKVKRFWRDTFGPPTFKHVQKIVADDRDKAFVVRCDFDALHCGVAGTGANSIHSQDFRRKMTFKLLQLVHAAGMLVYGT